MQFDEILNALEDMVESSISLPLTRGHVAIDGKELLEFIKELRLQLPEEMKRSKKIIKEREDIISRARAESEAIIGAAHAQAKVLVSEQEIYKTAQSKATEIVSNAQNAAKEIRQATIDYCDNVLKKTEDTLKSSAENIKRGIDSVADSRKNIRKSDK